jgi:hypothetical protein
VSVRLSAFIGMTLAGQISIKFYIQDFYWILSEKSKFC